MSADDRVKKGKNKYAKIMDVRKTMFNVKQDPLLTKLNQTNEQLPANLLVDNFVESRAHEIKHFTEYINKRPSTKLIHQMLPRNLKRRAMSHNYFRIPLRIRYVSYMQGQNTQNLMASKKKTNEGADKNQPANRAKLRKHKRRTKSMLKSFHKRSQNGYQWLETHIWHAKRFHIENLWGHKVPIRCNDKCLRGVYRFTQLSSCMIDLSYHITLKFTLKDGVSAGLEDVLSFIKFESDSQNSTYSHNAKIVSTTEGEMICPCKVLFWGKNECMVNFHPSAMAEIIGMVEQVGDQVECKKVWLNQFEIMGKEIPKALYSVFRSLLADQSQIEMFDSTMLSDWTTVPFQSDQPVFLKIRNPNSDFRMNERVFKYQESGFKEQNFKQLTKEGLYFESMSERKPSEIEAKRGPSKSAYKSKQLLDKEKQLHSFENFVDCVKVDSLTTEPNNIHHDSFGIISSNQDLYMNCVTQKVTTDSFQTYRSNFESNLVDHFDSLESLKSLEPLQTPTTRTNYSHRKQTKDFQKLVSDVKNKPKIPKLSKIEGSQKDEEIKKGSDDSIKRGVTEMDIDQAPENQPNLKNQKLKLKQRDEIVVMLIFQKSENGFGHSFKLFVESGYSLGLLRRFSYAGTKIIGLKEYRTLNIERQVPTFPYDYPSTMAYKTYDSQLSQNRLLAYCKKPPSKRLNFCKINSPHPFQSDWSNLKFPLVKICLTMPKRTSETLFYICAPKPEDMELETLDETVDAKMFEQLGFDPKDFNKDYEQIYQQKVYENNKGSKQQKDTKTDDIVMKSSCDQNLKILDSQNLKVTTGLKMAREIIGYVTSGGYSLHKGYGISIGSIESDFISSKDSTYPWVWVRNPASTLYYKAKIAKTYSG